MTKTNELDMTTEIVDVEDTMTKFLIEMKGNDYTTAMMEMKVNSDLLINLALSGIIDILESTDSLDRVNEIAERFIATVENIKGGSDNE